MPMPMPMPRPETRARKSSAGTLLSTVMLLAIIFTTTWLRTGVAHDIVRPLSNVAEIPASPAQTSRFGHRRSSRRTADGCAWRRRSSDRWTAPAVAAPPIRRARHRPAPGAAVTSRGGGCRRLERRGVPLCCAADSPSCEPARGADGAATAGPHQRSLLRPSVARAARALMPPPPPPPLLSRVRTVVGICM